MQAQLRKGNTPQSRKRTAAMPRYQDTGPPKRALQQWWFQGGQREVPEIPARAEARRPARITSIAALGLVASRRGSAASRRGENPPGAGIDRSHARRTSKGRESIGGGIPFASKSHHFPNLLFCGPLRGVHCGQVTPAKRFGVRNKGSAELPAEPAISGKMSKRSGKGDFKGPNAQSRASSCPSRACKPWPCPG